jgi:hypothetical protein
LFDRHAEACPFAFPSRGGAAPAVVAWAAPAGDEVRTVAFRRKGEERAAHAAAPAAPEPAREAAPKQATPPPPPAEVVHEPPIPPAADVPWLDLPAASVAPGAAGLPPVGPLLPSVTLEEERAALSEAASALVRARTGVLSEVESELLELAVDIATVLIEDELASRPELHRSLVRAALAAVEPGEGVKVRASRATYEALLEAFDSATVEHGAHRVQVELDDTVEGLGAVVQSGGARVDGRVGTRIEALKRALIDARRSRDAA